MKVPKIGDDIYIPTSLYLSHGVDDFEGGLCEVIKISEGVSAGSKVPFVEVKERPGHSYNWEYLQEKQGELKERFGNRRGYPDPDYHPDSNRWD